MNGSQVFKSESDPARASEVVASIPSYVLLVFQIVVQEEISSSFVDVTIRPAVILKLPRTILASFHDIKCENLIVIVHLLPTVSLSDRQGICSFVDCIF